MSPAEEKLASRLGDHLNYNTGDFAINKTCIRNTVHPFPVCEAALIINHGFKRYLEYFGFRKCKVLADYQGELIQERITQW